MSIFGPFVTGWHVEQKILTHLETWLGTYIDRANEVTGLSLEGPRSLVAVSEFSRRPEEQLPALAVVTSELVDPPVREGDGLYTAVWEVTLAIQVPAATEPHARRNAHLYAGLLTELMLQQSDMDGAEVRDWRGGNIELVPVENRRTQAGARSIFHVSHQDVLNDMDGPDEPNPDAGLDWPDVLTQAITVEPEDPIE